MELTEVEPINRELGPQYMGVTKDYDLELARVQFQARYGYLPERVIEEKFCYLLGPIKEEEEYENE